MVQDTRTTLTPALRLPRRLAGGVVAAGALASCLALGGQSAFAATSTHAAATSTAATSTAEAPTADQALAAFHDAGYTSTDGIDLAVLWGSSTTSEAKVTAGTELLAHQELPYAPGHAPTRWSSEQDVAAFAAGGGSYQEALQLAALWGNSAHDAKVTAGQKLLEGADPPSIPKTWTAEQDVNAFYAGGGDFREAVQLAVLWGSSSAYDAKVTAGAELLDGYALPVPKTCTAEQDVQAFLLSGGDHQEALSLAAVWGSDSVGGVKARAGAEYLAGQDLPKVPKTFTKGQDVNAFLAAGYDHADAEELAHLWHSRSAHTAEVTAGAKLLAGQDLPIQP